MSQCLNCKTKLSCGCQKRNATNGVQVCTNCLSKYESQIVNTKQQNNVITQETFSEVRPHRRGQALRKFIN